ncbi:glycoside hydrolase family 64 protein [Streptomyces sp. NBC_00638]|uniref:glycoside hydrolase family 64 protein n=1 Tax=unclassified Streptomyces TaxID=2593676 RepID=UPI002253B8E3|nr:glycoside hydrolase family 64 protein [Streptomyces sp. NBC_00638]MCX5007482.1 glycoside hydrolase family 64 protein [Streptomyces sp. NBC_00638]
MLTRSPAGPAASRPVVRRKAGAVLAALLTVLVLGLAGAVPARAAADYTQGVASTGSGSVQIWFTPTAPASLVDVHYLSPGAGQQNFRMTNTSGTWRQSVSGLPSGFTLEYWFTYERSGPLLDTPHFTHTVGSGGGGGGGGTGSFPITFQNNTRGTYGDSQIYVTVLGQVTPGQWSYMKAAGTMAHISHLDASAPGHLTRNGVSYPNMSFTLAQSGGSVPSPTSIRGGRIYVSLGSPLYIPVSPDDQGWGGPDLRNPNDPNTDVYYDWYEYTYVFGQVAFGGNTTQVDQFGFPMTSRLTQASSGYDTTRGITLTRAQVMSQYAASVGAAFRPLQNPYRIVAPRSSDLFLPGGSQADHLQPSIDQAWSYYSTHPFKLTRLGETFTGRVAGTTLTFTKNGAGPYTLRKPSSADVMACAGALASGSDPEKQLGAEFCAAFNRGVALDTTAWYTPSAYYTPGAGNDYAAFLHTVGLDKRAYAFPYDDVNDQSSVQILGNASPPTGLTLGIGW